MLELRYHLTAWSRAPTSLAFRFDVLLDLLRFELSKRFSRMFVKDLLPDFPAQQKLTAFANALIDHDFRHDFVFQFLCQEVSEALAVIAMITVGVE